MIKPDQRQRIRRINQLQLAADVIVALQAERPELVALYVHQDIVKQLRTLAEQYEAKPLAPVLRVHDEQRKPVQRVAMSRRRPTIVPKPAIKNYLDMSPQELIQVGRDALAAQGKSPNHRRPKLKLGSKIREIPLSDLDSRPGEPGRAECGHPEGSAFCTICATEKAT